MCRGLILKVLQTIPAGQARWMKLSHVGPLLPQIEPNVVPGGRSVPGVAPSWPEVGLVEIQVALEMSHVGCAAPVKQLCARS